MRIFFSTIIFAVLMISYANAQSVLNQDSGTLMRQLQNAEEELLRSRDAYISQETEVSDPIWIRGEDGGIHIIDGVKLRQRVQGFVFTAQVLGLEQTMLDALPSELRIMVEFLGEETRADLATDRMMEGYRSLSIRNRQEIFSIIEVHLDRVRDAFFAAMEVRDAGVGNNSDSDSGSGESGITVNQSKLALSGVRACSTANLESGRKWLFRNPDVPGASTYHETTGFICRGDGVRFFKLDGQSLTGFSCASNWSDCASDPSFDSVFRPPTRNSQLAGQSYTVWTLEWTNGTTHDWDLWIED